MPAQSVIKGLMTSQQLESQLQMLDVDTKEATVNSLTTTK